MEVSRMIYINHHGEMGVPLAYLLNARHLDFTFNESEDDLLLIDMDFGVYAKVIDSFPGEVVIYPHGAGPILTWGVHEPHERVSKNLVTSEGHKEVMLRYGYPKPIEVIGWYLCELGEWKPPQGNKVLYCPIHPIMGGKFMFEEDTKENVRVFRELMGMDVDLSVRYRHQLVMNGLHIEDNVDYYKARWFDDLENYDLVVANGTLAYVAIAKGIPTVMLKQDTCVREPGDGLGDRVEARSVEKYWEYMRYPYGSEDFTESMRLAAEREPVEWKERFIGKQMDGGEFVKSMSEA
jgi:hypothetical protein